MKNKSIYFANFNYQYTNINENINNLSIENISNVNTNNGFVQSELSANSFLDEIFNEEKANFIFDSNYMISKVKKFTVYEYFNEINNKKETRLFAITIDDILFELNNETLIFEEKYKFLKLKNEVIFNNILYFFDTDNKCVVIEENNILSVENIPQISSFAFYESKLYFSIDSTPNKIYISENKNLKDISLNLEQYSEIIIPIECGAVCKIANIKNQIYIVTQYSIYKLNKSENTIQKQNNINSQIFIKSVIQYDDSILFYSKNGLFVFDGTDIKQIFNNYLNIDKNANFVSYNSKLYIFTSNFENIINVYDLQLNQFIFICINNIKNIYTINTYSSYIFCVCYEEENILKNISLYNSFSKINFPQTIKFKPIFFTSNNLKQIQSIILDSTGEFLLKIHSDISSSTFNIPNATQLSNLTLNGSYFIFEIYSKSAFKLNSILLTYSELGE